MPIRPTLTILASLLAGLLAIPPGALASADEKLLAAARAAQPAVIESLKAMVAIESGTMDGPGLGKMTDYAEARLKALGLQVERRPASTASTGNMSLGTLKGWLNTPRNGGVAVSMPSSLPQSRQAQQWSAAERLLALHESHGLHGAALHAWCREKGVFEHQLVCWRDAFVPARSHNPQRRRAPPRSSSRPCRASTWSASTILAASAECGGEICLPQQRTVRSRPGSGIEWSRCSSTSLANRHQRSLATKPIGQ